MQGIRSSAITVLVAFSCATIVSCAQTSSVPVPATPAMGVRLRQAITGYEVTGTSSHEIIASVATNARLQPDRTGYAGYTSWSLNWSYAGSEPAPGGCSPSRVTIVLDLNVRYPTWTDSAAAPITLRQEWNRYVTALKAHEGNHAAIAIRGANQIARELDDLVSPNCVALTFEARRLVSDGLRRIRNENEKYDETTRHGSTEGANLGGFGPAP